jgi:hypothetical protein
MVMKSFSSSFSSFSSSFSSLSFFFSFFSFLFLFSSCSVFATEFTRQFAANFNGGASGLQNALKQRKQWTALQAFDNYKEFPPLGHAVFDSLGPVIQCPSKLLSTYGKGDGEKRICGLMTDPCVVISLGSNNVWDFEDDFATKHPECKVHTFDCFVPGKVPSHLVKSVTSHAKCIGPRDEVIDGKEFLSWPSILKLIGTETAPTALKMDIEGFEWTVIREMIHSSPKHLLPLSISLELHLTSIEKPITWLGRFRQEPEVALFMEHLMKFGYVLVDRHDNPFCLFCSEIVVARIAPFFEI